MTKNSLKSVVTFIVIGALTLSFLFVVIMYCDERIANHIVSTFLTIATSIIGFYIGYQNNKNTSNKDSETVKVDKEL